MRILIADDESIIRLGLKSMLQQLDHEVVAARDGREALQMARAQRPDLAILDVKMPFTDGLQVARVLARSQPMPIVLLTAYSDQALIDQAADLPIHGYLVKPVQAADLAPAMAIAVRRFADAEQLRQRAAALEADSPADRTELVRRFLAQRDHRRLQRGLPAAGEIYERQREWLEGMALYVELATWRQASQSDYAPLPELVALDADFYGYGDFDGQWRRAISTLRRQANQGDTRFYYSGMAQAFLLDALLPGWKDRIMEGGVWLEGLLAEAVAAAD